MKIAAIDVFGYEVRFAHGDYGLSRGRTSRGHRALVVRVRSEDGAEGWGETSPHGHTYLPSFVEGEEAALRLLGPAVLGLDPRDLGQVNRAMDATLLGGTAAKSAIDAACWDLFGHATGLPVATLLGGRLSETFRVFLAVPVGDPDGMATFAAREHALGLRVLQVKVGDDPLEDVARTRAVVEAVGDDTLVVVDANGGWTLQAALVAARRLEDLPIYLEQPCRTLTECAEVRRHTSLPLVLDESVGSLADLVAARAAGAGGVNLKPGKVGGLTKARAMRDAAVALGMTLTVDDTWGGGVVTAQNAHLAASTDPRNLVAASYFTEWTEPLLTTGPRMLPGGIGSAPTAPGLGVDVDPAVLGEPLLNFS